ncbi:MAG: Transcription initiation factor TFIID subunit 9 [Caeruleum heppii]|nr:MAG: Transcription initiation factor TFIID subunit 9 [Caeruleum heppii]
MSEPNGIADPPASSPQPAHRNSPSTPHHASQPPPSRPAVTSTTTFAAPEAPPTSLTDDGTSKRPRDARLIHMILASLGINAYEERVPLQLLDFAYRYTSSTLQDAVHLTAEGYGQSGAPTGNAFKGSAGTDGTTTHVTLPALRLSISSRLNYQFQNDLGKEFLLDLAQERNRVGLPGVPRQWGLRLPPERYCLTGVGWGLKEEWESEGEDEVEADGEEGTKGAGVDGDGEGEAGAEDGDDRMEDLFGDEGGDNAEDKSMADA